MQNSINSHGVNMRSLIIFVTIFMFYDLLGYCEYFIKLLTTIWQIFINQKI